MAFLTHCRRKTSLPLLFAMSDLANRIVGHYEKHAVEWDRDRQASAWNDKIWHDRFIARFAGGAAVLDLGCGPGRPVAQHMVERGLRVTGIDSLPKMISFCRDRLPDQDWIGLDSAPHPVRGLRLFGPDRLDHFHDQRRVDRLHRYKCERRVGGGSGCLTRVLEGLRLSRQVTESQYP
jgi:SAM-dependent methyltransferase